MEFPFLCEREVGLGRLVEGRSRRRGSQAGDVYIKIGRPLRFICSGKGFEDWSPLMMNGVIASLIVTLEKAVADGRFLMDADKEFFPDVKEAHASYRSWLEHTRKDKSLAPDGRTKHPWFALASAELFDPADATNKKTTELTARFLSEFCVGALEKMRDPKGATAQYCPGGDRSVENACKQAIADTLGLESTNDKLCESVFGLFTYIYNNIPNVAVESVSGIVAGQRNGIMERVVDHYSRPGKEPPTVVDGDADPEIFDDCAVGNGQFVTLDERHKTSLVVMSMRRDSEIRDQDKERRAAQDAYYHQKREDQRAAELEALVTETMNAIDSFEMYRDRGAKTVGAMHKTLRQLKSSNAKLVYLKEQILIRVVGFGWHQFATQWSSVKDPYVGTEPHLTAHLSSVLQYELSNGAPDAAYVPQLVSRRVKQLGTPTEQRIEFNTSLQVSEAQRQQHVAAARARRDEATGGSTAHLQPHVAPPLEIGMKLEIKKPYWTGREKHMHWFACTILRLSDGKTKFGRQKKAMEKGFGLVRWDPWKPDDDDGSADEEDDEEDEEYEEE